MWEKVSHWILTQGTFAGLEYLQKPDGFYYNLTILQKEKGIAKIIATHTDIGSIEALKVFLEETIPVYLVINIGGMLHRKLDYTPTSKKEALQAVFPSANTDDFLVQQTITKRDTLISIIRKESCQEIIGKLKKNKVEVIKIFAGNFLVQHLLAVIAEDISSLPLIGFSLTIEQHQIVSFDKAILPVTSIALGDQRIDSTQLPSVTMAFLGITQSAVKGLPLASTQATKGAFLYKRLFYYTSMFLLGFFFVALLINYFLFEQYATKAQELKLELTQQQNLLKQRDTLAQILEQKKAVLGGQMTVGKSKTSFYSDQLAASLPNSMQLLEMIIYPVIETNDYGTEEKIPQYETNVIRIKGKCQASVFYNDWKRNIQTLSWVKSIQNISYQNDQNGIGIFELEITLQ
jgi:hypothetical protein